MRVAAGAAAAALALTGCGDALDEFRDDLRPLEQQAEQRRSALAAELRSVSLGSRRDARAVRAGTAGLSKTYAEIAALEPPDDYEKPFAAYVRANERLVRNLGRFADDLAAGDAHGLRRAGRGVVGALGESRSARLRWLE